MLTRVIDAAVAANNSRVVEVLVAGWLAGWC